MKKQIKITSYRYNMFFCMIDRILLYKRTKVGIFLDNLFKHFSFKVYKMFIRDKINNMVNNMVNNYDINNMPLFKWIEIETINRCNGKCSFCPVNVNEQQRLYAKMEEKLFKKIIDELAYLNFDGNVNLFSNNEPFLDTRIVDFSKYARLKLPKARILIMTNGSILTVDKCKEILPYLDELYIDNYNDQLIMNSNVKKIYKYFRYDNVCGKKISISMRLENEILTSRGGSAPNKRNIKTLNKVKCTLPFRQIVIRPTGEVSLCCNDPLGKNTLGNVNIQTLYEIWYSENYSKIRKSILNNGRKEIENCKFCDFVSVFH